MGVEGFAQGPLSCRQADGRIPNSLHVFTDAYSIFQKPEDHGDQEYETQAILYRIFIKGLHIPTPAAV